MQEVSIFSVQHTVLACSVLGIVIRIYGCMKAQFSGYCDDIYQYPNAIKSLQVRLFQLGRFLGCCDVMFGF